HARTAGGRRGTVRAFRADGAGGPAVRAALDRRAAAGAVGAGFGEGAAAFGAGRAVPGAGRGRGAAGARLARPPAAARADAAVRQPLGGGDPADGDAAIAAGRQAGGGDRLATLRRSVLEGRFCEASLTDR